MSYDDLFRALGHSFDNVGLLEEALTHRTWLNEQHQRGRALDVRDQQRLEFLGDAFLGYVVGRYLHEVHPEATEGALTQRRAALVRGERAHAVGEALELRRYIRLGAGEQLTDRNKKLLEDTVEALIGAALLDAGDEKAAAIVRRLFLSGYDAREAVAERDDSDAIIAVNELWQQIYKESLPKLAYTSSGMDHASIWRCELEVDGQPFSGEGPTCKAAKRDLCSQLLPWLHETHGRG